MRQQAAATVWQVSGASIAAFVGLWLAPMTGGLARAEPPRSARAARSALAIAAGPLPRLTAQRL